MTEVFESEIKAQPERREEETLGTAADSTTTTTTNTVVEDKQQSEPPNNKPDSELNSEAEEATLRLSTLYNQITGTVEKEMSTVFMDHCYSRPWNWRPESNFLRPTKTLFVSKPSVRRRLSTNPLAPLQDDEDTLDVEYVAAANPLIYDEGRARQLMEEGEKHAKLGRGEQQGEGSWEEGVLALSITWTEAQKNLFNEMVNILNADHMARLAYSATWNEPVMRRTVIEKSVKRLRRLFATISWDNKLVQWLHYLLLENLSKSYLAAYLDILQTLRSKLPTFVDKMFGPYTVGRLGPLSYENLFGYLKKPWDPVASTMLHEKPKKLPGNPVIVVVPTAPTAINSIQSKRLHKWINLMTNLAHVVHVSAYIGSASHRMTMTNCIDQMLASTRTKLQEIRNEFPGRNIILVGFNAGAALALQVAQVEPVLCVVCLGFSLLTAEGRRGDPDDNLLELQCPVLFVVGQCSNTSLQEEMEDLRERMRVETGLIVVGGADDYLRISKKKKRAEGITQSVVDRFIADEVGEFVSGILLSPCPPQLRQSPVQMGPDVKRMKLERKRYNSNASSVDSEPPSPTIRMSRPVGRPPGSKARGKLEAKWAAQGTTNRSTPSPPPPHSPPPPLSLLPTPITPDTSSTDSSTLTDKSTQALLLANSQSENTTKSPKNLLSNLPPQNSDKARKLSQQNFSSPSKATTTTTATTPATGSTLHHLLQGKAPPKPLSTGIKVLEGVTLNSATSAKFISSSGRSVDLSKITVLNPMGAVKGGGQSSGNVVLMPDGKLKTVPPPPKTLGAPKYITSKKQLMGNRPPKTTMKKPPYITSSSLQSSLPPPANLTSQDIMDLPIVFADDNQILTRDNTIKPDLPSQATAAPPTTTFKIANPSSTGKFVFVNSKSGSAQGAASSGNIIISPASIKKASTMPLKSSGNPIKYTKIILTKQQPPAGEEGKNSGGLTVSKIAGLPSEITVKKLDPSSAASSSTSSSAMVISNEPIDLENELVATAVPNPNFVKHENLKGMTIITKRPDSEKGSKPLQVIISEALAKRTAAEMADDADDPDYRPSKRGKLEGV